MKPLMCTSLLCVILISFYNKVFGINSSTLPNHITEEEFKLANVADHFAITFSNTSALKFPGNASTISLMRPGFKYTLWPFAKVPYTIDSSFTTAERAKIALAMQTFHLNTCLRFIPKTIFHLNYVDIVKNPEVCSQAEVCMGVGRTFAEIGGDCIDAGKIIQVFGHTICMSREETRKDRDKWIAFSNSEVCQTPQIDKWYYYKGLDKLYDYLSVEHNEENCQNGCYLPKESGVKVCGSGGTLSVLDIEAINEVYGCKSGCFGYRFVNPNSQSLKNRFPVGNDFDGTPLYTCRAYHEGDIIPGRYNEETEECFVPWGGLEHKKVENVEVFTTPYGGDYRWISSTFRPPNAVRGGRSNVRETLFIIRCLYTLNGLSVWIPGKLHPSAGYYIAYGGVEIRCTTYEYLVCV